MSLILHYLPGIGTAKRQNLRKPEMVMVDKPRLAELVTREGRFFHRLANGLLIPHRRHSQVSILTLRPVPMGGAVAFTGSPDLDFESAAAGFDATRVEVGNSLTVTTDAVLNGTYGLEAVNGGTNDDGNGSWNFTAEDQVWAVCLFKVVSDLAVGGQQGHFMLNAGTGGGSGTFRTIAGMRSQAGFTNRAHMFSPSGSWDATAAIDYATNTLYGVSVRYKRGTGADSEHQVEYTDDGSTWADITTPITNGTNTDQVDVLQIGTDNAAAAITLYFDEVLADDTARPTLNWPSAGGGRVMGALAGHGGLAGMGGLAGIRGGLAG